MFQKRAKRQTVSIQPDEGEEEMPVIPQKRPRTVEGNKRKEDGETEGEVGLQRYGDGNATVPVDTEEDGRDKTVKAMLASRKILSGEEAEGVYRGQSNYPIYVEKSERDLYSSKFTGSLGPIKAPKYYKASCRFDYAMGICKDWKEAGYCGFGDSCIFVHDRSDYKSGYQMEKDWEQQQEVLRKKAYGEKVETEEDYEIKEEGEGNSRCLLCGEEWKEPVITECGHVFCLNCALRNYAKTRKCYECGADTKGIFNNVEV